MSVTVPESFFSPTIEDHIRKLSPELLKFVKDGDGLISGSTAMYYYMKKRNLIPGFIPGDVDLFIPYERQGQAFDLARKLHTGGEETAPYGSRYGIGTQHLVRVDKCLLSNGIVVDFILIGSGSTSCLDYVDQFFDLEFCKCWYDGKNLYGPYESLKSRKCVLNFTPLYQKDKEPGKMLEYFDKVKNFKPTNEINKDEDYYQILTRLKKYTSRGFQIDVSKFEIPKRMIDKIILDDVRSMIMNFEEKYKKLGFPVSAYLLYTSHDQFLNNSKGVSGMLLSAAKYFVASLEPMKPISRATDKRPPTSDDEEVVDE